MRLFKYIVFSLLVASVSQAGIFGGTNTASAIYAGTNSIASVYAGTNLVWSSSPIPSDGLALWLDASDTSTVTTNATGNVTVWADKSSVGDDALQVGSDTTIPLYCSNQQNGLCAISFDGGDYLGVNYKSTENQTVFVVNTATNGTYVLGSITAGIDRSYFGRRAGVTIGCGVGDESQIHGTALWGQSYHYSTWHYNGTTVVVRADGAEEVSQAQSGTGVNAVDGYYIGAVNYDGAMLGPIMGNIGEVIVYKRVLTAGEITEVETYLAEKWGL